MENKIKVSKMWTNRKNKNGFHRDEQRYKCNRKLLNYLGGNGFRKIERLMGVSHVSVINWVKKFASKIKNIPKRCEKVNVLELDEMCVSSKKNMALDCCKPKN